MKKEALGGRALRWITLRLHQSGMLDGYERGIVKDVQC